MSAFIRFDGFLWENMRFERRAGWETDLVAHRPQEGDGTYLLELRDSEGAVLVGVSPRVDFGRFCTFHDHTLRWTRVVAYLPFHPGARELVFRRGEYVIHRDAVAAEQPRIRITDVKRRTRGLVHLAWRATHPDDKRLSFNVAYLATPQRGFVLARDLERTEYMADVRGLPGGRDVRFAVLATDGTRSAFAVSKRLTVPDKRPVISIQAPRPGQVFPADQPITLCGQATDVAGASLPDRFLLWRVARQDLARGTRLALLQNLEPGKYRVTLRYRPETGVGAAASVSFAVAGRSRAQKRMRRVLAQQAV